MSVDNSSSGDNCFSNQTLKMEGLSHNAQIEKPSPYTLLGSYTYDQLLAMLADLLAKAPPDSATITGKNGLFRINWFDGRFLTAQAFRQQDCYWELRLRLLAQIFPPGISWGLGLSGLEQHGYDSRREADNNLDQKFTLRPGVAFDGIGRPIVVGQDFEFCFRDLIPRFQSEPRQVAASGQRFQSCLCLEPFNGGAGTLGSALPPGPYLLMIEARERPEGDAKVYGEACAGDRPARCEHNGWRGEFGLSLVRFPADPPSELSIGSSWDLRGVLAAYYYDVFEHSLVSRWDPEFARDDAFCEAVGSDCQQAGAVPLAMTYIGFDGSVFFLDQWIPRRGLAATAAANWTRTHIGAPTQSAADARLHQFQCMLRQSLAIMPLETSGGQTSYEMNLYERGFRHIPPVGFLPFDLPTTQTHTSNDFNIKPDGSQNPMGGNWRVPIPASVYTALVERLIDRYFCGTNVIPYYVVALHDDDVLEDISNAFDKDPVRLDLRSAIDNDSTDGIYEICREAMDSDVASHDLHPRFIKVFSEVFQLMLSDTDLLVNRDVELVKVIIPLQGLRRKHPLVGTTDWDAAGSLKDWYRGEFSDLERDRLVLALRERFGMDSLPRHFVVYVKQRMVLLDVIYVLFEFLNQWPAFSQSFDADSSLEPPMKSFHQQYSALLPAKQAAAQAAFGVPLVREVIAFSAVTANRQLASPQMWNSFFEAVDAQDALLAGQIEDPVLRRQQALDLVADTQAMEIDGFDIVKVLIASQNPQAAEASLRSIQRAATVAPALNERGLPRGMTLNQELLHDGKLRVFTQEDSRELWQAVVAGLKQQPASNLVDTASADATIEEVLKLTADEAEVLLGGSDGVDKLRGAIKPKIDKIAGDIDDIAAHPPSAKVIASFQRNLETPDGDPLTALEKTQHQFSTDKATKAKLERIKTMADLLGKDGFQPVANVVFRKR